MFDFNAHQRAIPSTESHGYRSRVMKQLVCADGFSMSVQASSTHYCEPRESDMHEYYRVEVGFPSAVEPTLMPFCENSEEPLATVYGYVPVEIVNAIINAHGGLKAST